MQITSRYKIYILFFFAGLPTLLHAQIHLGNNIVASEHYVSQKRSPLFIENKGQIIDQDGKQRADIDYSITANNVTVFVGKGQMHYQWSKSEAGEQTTENSYQAGPGTQQLTHAPIQPSIPQTFSFYRMDVTLMGANPNAEIITEEKHNYYENYYLPQCPDGAKAHSFSKIIYKNIYPDIDWVIYTTQENVKDKSKNERILKYDFVVHAGGNARDIKLIYEGANSLTLKDGTLIATTPLGSISEQAPYTYEIATGKKINSAYQLDKNILGFNIDSVNTPIIIDPKIGWATYFGGNDNEFNNIASTDIAGNAYLTGATLSINNIATSGAYLTTKIGANNDGYLAKFDAQGQLSWATYYGGNGDDGFSFCSYDSSYLYVAGATSSDTGIATAGSYKSSLSGLYDALLAKFDTSGNRIWATYYGGSALEGTTAGTSTLPVVTCDHLGHIYLVGGTTSNNGIATPGTYMLNLGSATSGFIARFTPGGSRIWGTYFTAGNFDHIAGVKTDSKGCIYVAGYVVFSGTATFPTPGCFQSAAIGGHDGFLAKFDSTGNKIWATYYGEHFDDDVYAMATDADDNVYIAGTTHNTTGIASQESYQNSYAGTNATAGNWGDGFLAKFDSAGHRQWATYYGGPGADVIGALAIGAGGTIFFSGPTNSTTGIATPGSFQPNFIAGSNFMHFIGEFSPKGTMLWASYFDPISGIGADAGSLVYNNFNKLYYADRTTTAGLATPNTHQQTVTGLYDDFLVAFFVDTTVHIEQPFKDSFLCAGDSFYLDYTVNTPFDIGNVFTVQLSNNMGVFINPTNIGLVSSNIPGTIKCIIPPGTIDGTNYRIRIIAGSPKDTSASSRNIQIATYPKPVIVSNTPVCEGKQLSLFVSSITPVQTFTWTGPTLNPTVAIALNFINASTALNGTFVVEANNFGCKAKDSVMVIINATPTKPVLSINTSLCRGDSLHLSAHSSPPGVSYQWTGANGFSSAAPDSFISNITMAATGYYRVQATLNGCSSLIDSALVTVHPIPSPKANNNGPVCSGKQINLTVTDTTAGVHFTWTGPHGYSSGSNDSSISNSTVAMSGNYVVTATAFNCTGKDSTEIIVKPTPAKPLLASNSPVCSGKDLNFTAIDSTSGLTYDWNGPNSYNATAQNPLIAFVTTDASGLYTATVTLDGCKNLDTISVLVKPTPAPQGICNCPIIRGQDLHLEITDTQKNILYAWEGPNNFRSFSLNPIIYKISATDAGSYFINATLDGCTGSGLVIVEVLELIDTGIFALYPNPNNGNFTVTGYVHKDQVIPVQIFDALGQLVYIKEFKTDKKYFKQDFSIPSLANGVYFFTLIADGSKKRIPFVIKQ